MLPSGALLTWVPGRSPRVTEATLDLMTALTQSGHCEPAGSARTVFFYAYFVFPEILQNIQFGILLPSLNIFQCS